MTDGSFEFDALKTFERLNPAMPMKMKMTPKAMCVGDPLLSREYTYISLYITQSQALNGLESDDCILGVVGVMVLWD